MTDPSIEPVAPDPPPQAGAAETAPAQPITPPKAPAETLTLRAAPRRIVRFKRGVVIGGAAVGSLAIAGVTWLALGPSAIHIVDQADDPVIADRRTPADAVANLPGDYGAVPQLGPPLPGDLGRPILERQRQLEAQGQTPPEVVAGAAMTPEEQAAEAERQRLAAQANQAREAGVIAQSTGRAATPIAADARRAPRRMEPCPPKTARAVLPSIPTGIPTVSSASSTSSASRRRAGLPTPMPFRPRRRLGK